MALAAALPAWAFGCGAGVCVRPVVLNSNTPRIVTAVSHLALIFEVFDR
jgi:hypothetical protein